MFEIADSQFSQFRSDRERVSKAYVSALESGDYSIGLDLASLDEYLDRSPSVERLRAAINAVGQTILDDGATDDFDKSNILAMLRLMGMTTVADLDALFNQFTQDLVLLEVVRDMGTPRTPVDFATFLVNVIHLENPIVDGEVSLGYDIEFDMSQDRAELAARRALTTSGKRSGDSV